MLSSDERPDYFATERPGENADRGADASTFRPSTSAYHQLIKSAEEKALACPLRTRARQPVDDFFPPQVEGKRLEFREQNWEQVAQRMPPAGSRIVDNNNLAPRFNNAQHLTQRSLAPFAWLLVEQEEHERPVIDRIGYLKIHGVHRQQPRGSRSR